MAAKINTLNELELSLRGKPRRWAQVIALRLALRSLPLLAAESRSNHFCGAVFRAMSISWAACNEPAYDIAATARAAARAISVAYAAPVARDAAHAATAAAEAAYCVADAAAAAVRVVARARFDATYAGDAILVEIDHDIALLQAQENGPEVLVRSPLWSRGEPERLMRNRAALFGAMAVSDPNARIWAEWYNCRLTGTKNGWVLDLETDDAITLRLVKQNEAFWGRDFSAINADIAAWIAEVEDQSELAEELEQPVHHAVGLRFDANDILRLDAKANHRRWQAIPMPSSATPVAACSRNAWQRRARPTSMPIAPPNCAKTARFSSMRSVNRLVR